MSLEFFDGFDHYSTSNMPQKGWQTSGGSMAAGRFGGQAWQPFGILGQFALIVLPSGALSSRIIGFALNVGGTANSIPTINDVMRLEDTPLGADTQLQFNIAAGFISVYRGLSGGGGTLLATASTGPVIRAGTWYYLEFKVTISSSAGSVQVNISDGSSSTTIINISGANTQSTANATFDTVALAAGLNTNTTTNASSYDDFYVCNTGGAVNNSFLGEVRVGPVSMTSDGHSTQWTPNSGANNFSRVNETLVDEDTSFVSSATPGQLDLYNHAALVTAGAILGVQTNITARKDDVGSRSIAAAVFDGATTFVNPNVHGVLSGYQDFLDIYETDPSTGLPWTVANFNARQFGVSVVS